MMSDIEKDISNTMVAERDREDGYVGSGGGDAVAVLLVAVMIADKGK